MRKGLLQKLFSSRVIFDQFGNFHWPMGHIASSPTWDFHLREQFGGFFKKEYPYPRSTGMDGCKKPCRTSSNYSNDHVERISSGSKINIFSLKRKGLPLFFVEFASLFWPAGSENEELFLRSIPFFLKERFSVAYLPKINSPWKFLHPPFFCYSAYKDFLYWAPAHKWT